MFCKFCGTQINDDVAFCPNCGSNLNAENPYTNHAPEVNAVPFNKQKDKVVAGILGIFLGSLGIHKFYLGYTKAGVIMLLVSLLTFGFGAAVMEIIGIIEGIFYLTKSDEEFYNTYEASQKEWF